MATWCSAGRLPIPLSLTGVAVLLAVRVAGAHDGQPGGEHLHATAASSNYGARVLVLILVVALVVLTIVWLVALYRGSLGDPSDRRRLLRDLERRYASGEMRRGEYRRQLRRLGQPTMEARQVRSANPRPKHQS